METAQLKQKVSFFFFLGLVLCSPFIYDWLGWVKPVL